MSPRRTSDDSSWRRTVVSSTARTVSLYLPSQTNAARAIGGWLLSEMVRSLGKDRFEVFWRSNEPVPDAFRSATGQRPGRMGPRLGRRHLRAAADGPRRWAALVDRWRASPARRMLAPPRSPERRRVS